MVQREKSKKQIMKRKLNDIEQGDILAALPAALRVPLAPSALPQSGVINFNLICRQCPHFGPFRAIMSITQAKWSVDEQWPHRDSEHETRLASASVSGSDDGVGGGVK